MIYQFKNIPINYSTTGEGPAMVLLHGFLESSKMWEPLLPELSKNRKIITIDLPGFGESGVISTSHSMELMAQAVNAILDHLNISMAILAGHSMGGYVTLAYAEMFPEKVTKVALLNSTPLADSEEKRKARNRAIKIVDQRPEAFISRAIANWAGEVSRERFSSKIEEAKNLAYTFPVEGIKAALRGMRDRKDRSDVLKSFPREKLMLLSKNDPLIPVEEHLELATKHGAKTTVVDGGHLSVIENLDAVRNFLLSL